MKKSTRYEMRDTRYENGSALILVVVLTSLLAIVGVMFVMVARVDRIATSGISENKTLDSAVEVVIARISQELALDVPRSDSNGVKLAEYYDYPGPADRWLASLEPYEQAGNYYWRQISGVTGFLEREGYAAQDVEVELPNLQRPKPSESWVRDYPEINVDEDGDFLDKNGDEAADGLWADADGDGVADSKWIELDDITSNKGKPIYAAIRVIDNGGMINVNTAYKFDPNETSDSRLIDGSRLAQIHMLDFVKGVTDDIDDLHQFRCDGSEPDLLTFNAECAVRIENPDRTTINYLPYDIGDELELRNRFVLDAQDSTARVEAALPITLTYPKGAIFGNRCTPIDSSDDFKDWKKILNPLDPNDSYNFRHLLTTYNFDRIIHPYGGKMLNINDANVVSLYGTIKIALRSTVRDVNDVAAQTAVNLIDFRDKDPNVTTLDVNGIIYYGFERPCVYISELAHRFQITEAGGGPVGSDTWRSYAVELYKPYPEDAEPNNWRLFIDNSAASPSGDVDVPVDWSGTQRFHVIKWENIHTELDVDFDSDPLALSDDIYNLYNKIFDKDSIISLQRRVDDVNDIWVSVDSHVVPGLSISDWLVAKNGTPVSIQRDITRHKCIRRLWADASVAGSPTLGRRDIGDYETGDSVYVQAHPENRPFTNIGEVGMVFRKGAYYQNDIDRPDRIGYGLNRDEEQVRLDLADPNYQRIFKYLTCFDPSSDGIDNDGDGYGEGSEIDLDELKVAGRININTAPWYVIAQLPWVSNHTSNYELAQAIVAYRDKLDLDPNGPNYYHGGANNSRYLETGIRGLREADGFASIGELATVVNDSGENDYSMRYYALDSIDLDGFPDLTPGSSSGDGAVDDFEERDVIFARISNLVTVRSDVFTAYILVRIGADGPQKRVMAILDRSNVYTGDGRVQIVALHAVADPR